MRKEEMEIALTVLVRRVTGVDPATAEPARFEPEALLNDDLDVDSLALVELAEEIESQFSVTLSDGEIKGLKSFGALTEYVESAVK